MYTQCPECQIAFRVSARILQQAAGNVRCGSCSHAFNALHYLSEDMPEATSADSDDTPDTEITDDDLAETSRRLLQTLDELAGPEEVRIEDTGVEWRVLDEAVAESAGPVLVDTGKAEKRYDDNTPLPDEFDDDADSYAPPPAPQRRTEDFDQPSSEFEDRQRDLALSEPEDWTDLLDEVRSPDPESFDIEEELAAIHSQLSTRQETPESVPDDVDTQFDSQAEAMGLDITKTEDDLTDEVPHLGENDPDLVETGSGLEFEDDDDVVVEADYDDIDDFESWQAGKNDVDLADDEDTGVFEIDDESADEADEEDQDFIALEVDADEYEDEDEEKTKTKTKTASTIRTGNPPVSLKNRLMWPLANYPMSYQRTRKQVISIPTSRMSWALKISMSRMTLQRTNPGKKLTY